MNARFSKWGHSLAIRIPAAAAREMGVSEGALADISVEDGRLVVKPLNVKRYDLEELLAGIDQSNLHGETETGPAVGNEFR